MLTDEQQLQLLIDRWALRPGQFLPPWRDDVVYELERVTADEPATLEGLEAYATAFVRVLGSVYKSLRQLDHYVNDHIAACRFAFGEKAAAGELRDVGAALVGPVIRFEGQALLIAKPAKRYQWVQAAAILDADEVFARLVEMGF